MEKKLKNRTRPFALRIMNVIDARPKTTSAIAEEAEEPCFRLERIMEGNPFPKAKGRPLLKEADEPAAISVSSIKPTQSNKKSKIGAQKS